MITALVSLYREGERCLWMQGYTRRLHFNVSKYMQTLENREIELHAHIHVLYVWCINSKSGCTVPSQLNYARHTYHHGISEFVISKNKNHILYFCYGSYIVFPFWTVCNV